MSEQTLEFTFPARYYARALPGHARKSMTLGAANTALLLSQTSNMGYPGVLNWRKDSPYARTLALFEHVPRMRRIIDEYIVPLVALARGAGVQIIYAVSGWESAAKYPQWQAIDKRVGKPEQESIIKSPNQAWMEEFEADVFMPGYGQAMLELRQVLDIAPPLAPHPKDWVVTNAGQAELLMNERGIWNVLCAGFDTPYDLRFSQNMRWRSPYRFFLLRDCTAGPERHDTIQGENLKNAAITIMEMGVRSYSALGSDIRAAIRKGQAGSPGAPPFPVGN